MLIGAQCICGLLAPLIAPHDPYTHHPQHTFQSPFHHEFILGTDNHGRDIFSRLLYGASAIYHTLLIALTIAIACGIPLGLLAAMGRRTVALLCSLIFDSLLAIPLVLLSLTAVSLFDAHTTTIAITIGIIFIPVFARQTRQLAIDEREKPYLLGVIIAGAPNMYIITRHILPAITIPLLRLGAISATLIIAISTTLSFLGIGQSPPAADWGLMLRDGRSYLLIAPWMTIIPGITLVVSGALFQYLAHHITRKIRR